MVSDGSRSQLTVETELMVPLAATECLPSAKAGTLSGSSRKESLQEAPVLNADISIGDEKGTLLHKDEAAEYVDELMALCFSAQTY